MNTQSFTLKLTNRVPFELMRRDNAELLNSYGYSTVGNYWTLHAMYAIVVLAQSIGNGEIE